MKELDFPSVDIDFHALRVSKGFDISDVAVAIGTSPEAYRDVEDYPGDFTTSLTLEQVFKLSDLLDLNLSHALDDGRPGLTVGTIGQWFDILKTLALEKGTLSIEDRAGYKLGNELTTYQSVFRLWNLDCLRSFSAVIGARIAETVEIFFAEWRRDFNSN